MAQTGYTPILIYSSSTTSNVPAAGSLTNSTLGSELAINITDGKLFYKDNANAVQVIGWKTTPTTAGGTGLTSYTAGDLLYYASGTTLSKLAIGASTTILTSSGTAPQWSAASGITVGTATNIAGGAAGSVPYQTGAGATSLLAIGTAYYQLGVNAGGTAPAWQPSATSVLTTQGDLLYASAANTLARLAKNTTASRYLSNSGSSNNPAWAQVDLTNGVTGTLPVANGGTGTATAFTAGSVVFAGASGTYTQNNASFFWDNTNARLGLGTATPSYTLQTAESNVAGIKTAARFGVSGNGGSGRGVGLILGAGGSNSSVDVAQIVGYQTTASATANNAALAFQVANSSGTLTEFGRFGNAGSFAVNTTTLNASSSSAAITLNGATSGSYEFLINGVLQSYLASTSATLTAVFPFGGQFDVSQNSGSANPIARFFSSGGVSIGNTTDPGAKNLSVNNKAFINATGPVQASEQFAINSSGLAAVSKTSAASEACLSSWNSATSGNNQFLWFYTEGSATFRGSVEYNRGAGLVAYNTSSDQRLKENIVDAPAAIDELQKIKIRSYDWKDSDAHVDYGVIAQELMDVAPSCVTVGVDNEDGSINRPWAVDTSILVPMLIKAVQELTARVALLESK